MFPRWVYFVIPIWFVFAVSMAVFIFKECGARALILGNGGFYAAATGMCD